MLSSGDQKPNRVTECLANERTFLAWLRTCIAIMGLGFIVARFSLFLREFNIITKNQAIPPHLPTQSSSTILGMSMIGLGILLLIYSLVNYLKAQKAIEVGSYVPKHNIMYLATIGLVVFGIIVLAYLVLISI
ncbi:MAG: YidH family protein [Nitrosotalea sp.]